MKSAERNGTTPIDTSVEINACIEHVKKIWDLSHLKFKDTEQKGDPATVLIESCVDYGLKLGTYSFLNNSIFSYAYSMKVDRINYLTDIMDWDYNIASKDSIVMLFNDISSAEIPLRDMLEEKSEGKINNYEKAVKRYIDKLNLTFDNLELIKPFGYDEYTSLHDDKELIYAYEDKIREEIDSFKGHSFDLSMHCFPSRVAISNTGYMDKEQGNSPYFELIGALYIQGKLTKLYNNNCEFMSEIKELNLNSPLLIDSLEFKKFENRESWFSFFSMHKDVVFSEEEITFIEFRKNETTKYFSLQEYLDSKNLDNTDITSRKIRVMLKKKNKLITEDDIDSLLG